MLVPATHLSALLVLVLSLVCLGSWANMFKLTGTRWRFELFYFDFAIGVIILAVIAAYTFGTHGDLAFSDRMLVAGRVAQVWIILAGITFNLGNILLVAAISLLGMSFAFPLAVGTGLVIWCCLQIRAANAPLLSIGIVLMLLTVLLDALACRKAVGSASKPASANNKLRRKSTKGIVCGVLGGIALGFFSSVGAGSMDPEFGVGPYAAILLFGIGIFLSSVVISFYFMKVPIEGPSLTFGDYFRGRARKHLLGFAGGIICLAGLLAAAVIDSVPPSAGIGAAAAFIATLASVLLAIVWGIARWKELGTVPTAAKSLFAFAVISFACGIVVIGFGLAS